MCSVKRALAMQHSHRDQRLKSSRKSCPMPRLTQPTEFDQTSLDGLVKMESSILTAAVNLPNLQRTLLQK